MASQPALYSIPRKWRELLRIGCERIVRQCAHEAGARTSSYSIASVTHLGRCIAHMCATELDMRAANPSRALQS